jgi:hypothetical protein
MGNTSAATILLYVVIAAFVIWRVVIKQLRGSTLSTRSLWLIPGILLVIGFVDTVPLLAGASGTEIGLLVVDLAVLVVLGVLRANSVTLSQRDGFAFQKGGATTLVLWLVTIGVRVGFIVLGSSMHAAGPLTSASTWLTVGLSVGVQSAVILLRAQQLGLPIAADRRQASRVGR